MVSFSGHEGLGFTLNPTPKPCSRNPAFHVRRRSNQCQTERTPATNGGGRHHARAKGAGLRLRLATDGFSSRDCQKLIWGNADFGCNCNILFMDVYDYRRVGRVQHKLHGEDVVVLGSSGFVICVRISMARKGAEMVRQGRNWTTPYFKRGGFLGSTYPKLGY